MTDLQTQLRGYFDEINPPFEPAELIQEAGIRSVPAPSPPRWGERRWAYATVAIAVVILVVGVTAWVVVGTRTDITPVITQPPPTSVPEITIPEATTPAVIVPTVGQELEGRFVAEVYVAEDGTIWAVVTDFEGEWEDGIPHIGTDDESFRSVNGSWTPLSWALVHSTADGWETMAEDTDEDAPQGVWWYEDDTKIPVVESVFGWAGPRLLGVRPDGGVWLHDPPYAPEGPFSLWEYKDGEWIDHTEAARLPGPPGEWPTSSHSVPMNCCRITMTSEGVILVYSWEVRLELRHSNPVNSLYNGSWFDRPATIPEADVVSLFGSVSSPVENWQMIPLPVDNVSDLFEGEIENLHAEWLFPMPGGRVFAVGSASTFSQEWQGLVWTTTDLLSWQRIDVGDRMDVVERMVPWEEGYLARGWHEGNATYETVFSTSEDGIAWTEIEFSEEMPQELLGDSVSDWFQEWHELNGPPCMFGHVLRTDSATTAVCRDTDGNVMSDEPVAFWNIDSDGTWQSLPTDPIVDKTQFGDVYDIGDAFITRPDSRGFFTSGDGRTWRFVEIEPTDFPADTNTEQIVVVDDRLVVVGNISDDRTTPAVWIADLAD